VAYGVPCHCCWSVSAWYGRCPGSPDESTARSLLVFCRWVFSDKCYDARQTSVISNHPLSAPWSSFVYRVQQGTIIYGLYGSMCVIMAVWIIHFSLVTTHLALDTSQLRLTWVALPIPVILKIWLFSFVLYSSMALIFKAVIIGTALILYIYNIAMAYRPWFPLHSLYNTAYFHSALGIKLNYLYCFIVLGTIYIYCINISNCAGLLANKLTNWLMCWRHSTHVETVTHVYNVCLLLLLFIIELIQYV